FDPGLVEILVERCGADHVLLGTDYPFDMGLPDPLALVTETNLPDSDRELITGGNAIRLFGLDD
ncbi:MAG: amidohydrolase family protein, partial [Acidimicrobiia bacterium]